jgi:acyl-coenzyme A synthetase/AMP-(fatty) acid ligase
MHAPTLPPLAARDPASTFAWRGGVAISTARFVADVAAQAAVLPPVGTALNLCLDRYRFAVALAAALQRGQMSLLPPNALPDTLSRLQEAYTGAYAIVDSGDAVPPGLTMPIVADQGCADDSQPAPNPIAAAQPAACLLTSGSTGEPTPHVKTWATLWANMAGAAQRLTQALGLQRLEGLTFVATVPPQHSYGLESSVLPALLAGAAFDAGRPFYPADIADALARVPRPRALVTTPFHLKTLLSAGLALPATELVLCATAPLSPQLATQAERAFGGILIEIYGCTEAGQVATRRTVQTDVWHTFGELRVRHGHEETHGRSEVSSSPLYVGPRPRSTASAPSGGEQLSSERPGDSCSGGLTRSGRCGGALNEICIVEGGHVSAPTPLADVLQIDDPTHFRLLGRSADLIHVAGKRSSLAHLNHHLNSIAGVQDGAFWLPDDVIDGIARPVVFVVAPGLDAPRIQDALRSRIEAVFLPRRVVLLDALPREATGKLTAGALRRLAAAHRC